MPTRNRTAQLRAPLRARANAKARKDRSALKIQARTAKAQSRFLQEFSFSGNVLRSAQAAGVGRRTVYDWQQGSAFKTLYDQALEDALDQLEEEARRRAVDGVLKPVYQRGARLGASASTPTRCSSRC